MKNKTGSKKKQENKELEAQKQAIEELKRKEQEKQQEEQRLKYEVKCIPTGLELIITNWCVEQIWQEVAPKDFMIDFISQHLKRHKLLDHFESLEIQTTAEFLIYIMIFSKERLKLDTVRTVILVNICWKVLRLNNCRYDSNTPPHNKDIKADWTHFSLLIQSHFEGQHKYFNQNEILQFLNYFQAFYFQNHKLFNFVFNNHQQREEINISIFIDYPLEISPLHQALYMGKKQIEVRLDDEENEEQELYESARKREEEQMLLSEQILQEELQKTPQHDQQQQQEINFIDQHIQSTHQAHLDTIKQHDLTFDKVITRK